MAQPVTLPHVPTTHLEMEVVESALVMRALVQQLSVPTLINRSDRSVVKRVCG